MSRRPKPQTPAKAWQPMFLAQRVTPAWKAEALRDMILEQGGDPDEVLAYRDHIELWANDRYVCCVERRPASDDPEDFGGTVFSISIHRKDRKPIRDWRHFQWIKNDIAGDEIEAIEIYPAESRLMDTANEYWLWCLPPGQHVGVGFTVRMIASAEEAARVGAKQRPLEGTG